LAIAGLVETKGDVVRSAYVAMHLTTWFVIVPLCLGAFGSGVVQSLATPWGLFRHYWVVTKLVLTIIVTLLLLLHTQPIERVAEAATRLTLTPTDLRHVRLQLVGDASAALFVLFATTMLSVYKPWGLTPYGVRMQYATVSGAPSVRRRQAAPSGKYVLLAIGGFVLFMVLLHLAGIGLHGH
jgi:hypothetical protein